MLAHRLAGDETICESSTSPCSFPKAYFSIPFTIFLSSSLTYRFRPHLPLLLPETALFPFRLCSRTQLIQRQLYCSSPVHSFILNRVISTCVRCRVLLLSSSSHLNIFSLPFSASNSNKTSWPRSCSLPNHTLSTPSKSTSTFRQPLAYTHGSQFLDFLLRSVSDSFTSFAELPLLQGPVAQHLHPQASCHGYLAPHLLPLLAHETPSFSTAPQRLVTSLFAP